MSDSDNDELGESGSEPDAEMLAALLESRRVAAATARAESAAAAGAAAAAAGDAGPRRRWDSGGLFIKFRGDLAGRVLGVFSKCVM